MVIIIIMKIHGFRFTDLKIIHRIQGQDRSRKGTGFIGSERGQLAVDYIAGMSIFLLTTAFVFQFMYGLFAPFQSYSDEVTLAAEKSSTVLVERLLVADKSGSRSTVDEGKLNYFMNTRLNYSNRTEYDSALRDLGLLSNEIIFDVNVSVSHTNSTLFNRSGIKNPNGPVLLENLETGTSKRFVLIVNSSTGYNETVYISVRVW